jgi:hypothetical protein
MRVPQRYDIEHVQMPLAFFSYPQKFMKRLLAEREKFLVRAYNFRSDIVQEDDAIVFRPEDFEVRLYNAGARTCVVIVPPTAAQSHECPLIGVSVAKGSTLPAYHTVERTKDGHFLLCGWGPSHDHYVFAEVDDDPRAMEAALLSLMSTYGMIA